MYAGINFYKLQQHSNEDENEDEENNKVSL